MTAISAVAGIVVFAAGGLFAPAIQPTLAQLGTTLMAVALIAEAQAGHGGIMQMVLGNRTITYVGKISYGIYLYHNVVAALLGMVVPAVNVPGIARFVIDLPITFALAMVSWYGLELPASRLKRFFPFP
jgi:peptidoglycan/LPS O-acetylase OafA/YrhL